MDGALVFREEGDDLGFDIRRVPRGDLILECRRDEHVALQLERVGRGWEVGCTGEIENTLRLFAVRNHVFESQPLGSVDGALVFRHADE